MLLVRHIKSKYRAISIKELNWSRWKGNIIVCTSRTIETIKLYCNRKLKIQYQELLFHLNILKLEQEVIISLKDHNGKDSFQEVHLVALCQV